MKKIKHSKLFMLSGLTVLFLVAYGINLYWTHKHSGPTKSNYAAPPQPSAQVTLEKMDAENLPTPPDGEKARGSEPAESKTPSGAVVYETKKLPNGESSARKVAEYFRRPPKTASSTEGQPDLAITPVPYRKTGGILRIDNTVAPVPEKKEELAGVSRSNKLASMLTDATGLPNAATMRLASNLTTPKLQTSEVAAYDPDAPFANTGRLLRCELVMTVDSIVPNTPIIALVTHDLWWNGKLVIPANSEVLGTASVDVGSERIICGTSWTIVLRYPGTKWDRKELVLRGMALNQDAKYDGNESDHIPDAWGLADGAAGLPGELVQPAGTEAARMFLATALSEAANALQERYTDSNGRSVTDNSARNAGLQALSGVLTQETERLEQVLKTNSAYVRVAAGKQFYLFVQEPISLSKALAGANEVPSSTQGTSPDDVIESLIRDKGFERNVSDGKRSN